MERIEYVTMKIVSRMFLLFYLSHNGLTTGFAPIGCIFGLHRAACLHPVSELDNHGSANNND
jgi:hypothetical protein